MNGKFELLSPRTPIFGFKLKAAMLLFVLTLLRAQLASAQFAFPAPQTRKPQKYEKPKQPYEVAVSKLAASGDQAPNSKSLSQICSSNSRLSAAEKAKLLASCLFIWRQKNGAPWYPAPFSLNAYKDLPEYFAILERQAGQLQQQQKFAVAENIYKQLTSDLADRKESLYFDFKLFNLSLLQHQKGSSALVVSRRYVALLDKYTAMDNSSGEVAKFAPASKAKLESTFKSWLNTEIVRAKKPSYPSKQRRELISAIATANTRTNDQATKESYQSAEAELYVADNQAKRGVAIFMDLALNGTESKRTSFLKRAIQVQHGVANWPIVVPWGKTPRPELATARRELRDMYTGLLEKSGKSAANWTTVAHIGLLNMVALDLNGAFELWKSAISDVPDTFHSSRALATMYATYLSRKDWNALISLARIGIKANLSGELPPKSYPSSSMLALGLLEFGKIKLSENQANDASKYLSEFCQQYPNHNRRDEGLYFLANAQHANTQHRESIESAKDLVERYPTSKYRPSILKLGGSWALNMSLEEIGLYFYQKLLTEFPTSKALLEIRDPLIDLYLGRELYGNAAQLLEGIVYRGQPATRTKLEAALMLLDLQDRYGSVSDALRVATTIHSLGSQNATARGHAWLVEAAYYANRKDYKKVADIDRKLSGMGELSGEAQEYLGEIRFLLAQENKSFNETDILSAELDNPLVTLNGEYGKYKKLQSSFLRVCEAGQNSYCGPAHLQISGHADRLYKRIEPIEIAQTLAKSEVDAFAKRQDVLLDALAKDAEEHTKAAARLMAEGQTNPDWTTQILWETSTDWNFDRITGEAGDGFIQFTTRGGS